MEPERYNKLHTLMDKMLQGWSLSPREQAEYEKLCDEWNESQVADMQRLNAMANIPFEDWLEGK
jgi:hypothetical protein